MSSAVENYLRQRQARQTNYPEGAPWREICLRCRKPQITCYCQHVSSITTKPRMLILMHPLESKHPVGTGRMAHRCLQNSDLWIGADFRECDRVNAVLNDPKLFPMILFPGPLSQNLTHTTPESRTALIPQGREPVVIVLDATWHLAKKMLHRSPNLQRLPRICFTPPRLSGFLVRKQPNAQCFSTIEAIHEVLSLFGQQDNRHDILLEVFNKMVAQQLSFRALQAGRARHSKSYFERKARRAKLRDENQQAV